MNEFWRWFSAECPFFGERFENLPEDELDRRIADLGIPSWEVGPGYKNPSQSSLVVSPSGDPDLLHVTRFVVERAPRISGWEFYAAKPPKKWERKFRLEEDESSGPLIDASSWHYALKRFEDGTFFIVIRMSDLSQKPVDYRRLAAEVFLDGELGEETRLELIGDLEVVDRFSDDLSKVSNSVKVLREHLYSLVGQYEHRDAQVKPGTRVRMTEAHKAALRGKCGAAGRHLGPFAPEGEHECEGCSSAHVGEFGDCVGIVQGPMDYNNCKPGEPGYDPSKVGPEVDVRWQPSNLLYGYHPDSLEEVDAT